MGPAGNGMVAEDALPVSPIGPKQVDLVHDSLLHGPQMNGQVRSVGHQSTAVIEQGATEIQTLFDVGRNGGLLQLEPHLLGDGHELVPDQ